MHVPMDILDSGGQLRKPNGDDALPSDVLEESCVLDLRKMDEQDKPWYKNILLNINPNVSITP